MSIVAFDTNLIIYWLENNPEFAKAALELIAPVIDQKESAVVSAVLCAEFIAGTGRAELLRPLFLLPNLSIVDVSYKIAKLAGELSHAHDTLKPMDAIHLATAIDAQASKFVTNDQQLLKIGDIQSLKIVPIL